MALTGCLAQLEDNLSEGLLPAPLAFLKSMQVVQGGALVNLRASLN
jgi:hypothetical protein